LKTRASLNREKAGEGLRRGGGGLRFDVQTNSGKNMKKVLTGLGGVEVVAQGG